MKAQQSIIGFTEAELGFFAAILLLLVLIQKPKDHPVAVPLPTPSTMRPSIEMVPRHDLDRLQRENERLKNQLVDANEQLTKLKGLRSHQKPSCIEKKVANNYLFDVTIEEENIFVVDGQQYSFASLMTKFAAQTAEASHLGCAHSIRVFHGEDVSADDYVSARKTLSGYFFVTDSD